MTVLIGRADAFHLPLRDESVDLVVTSPPFFALRSYRDDGDHYSGQIGSEATPQAFLEALWAVTRELYRVLKPAGSVFFNLGDKRAGTGGGNNQSGLLGDRGFVGGEVRADSRLQPRNNTKQTSGWVRNKSKMLLPHRYAIGCADGLADPHGRGWVVRQDIVHNKLNGLPESITDRCRDSHEYWFHLTKEEVYFSATDEIREVQRDPDRGGRESSNPHIRAEVGFGLTWVPEERAYNPLGRVPGSVWSLATEPLQVPPEVAERYDLPDHYASFGQEWPRRFILGWSPSGICVECGEGRRPISQYTGELGRHPGGHDRCDKRTYVNLGDAALRVRGIVGYVCACTPRTSHRGQRGDWKEGREVVAEQRADDWHLPGLAVPRRPGGFGTKVPPPEEPEWEYHLEGWKAPPTRPSVILDPFAGTGTVAGVARTLGRIALNFDLSWDYCRLARWRVYQSGNFVKTETRTNRERQGVLPL